jgi:Cysteine-rich CPCC
LISAFDRAAFELRRDTFEDVLGPELTAEQRVRIQQALASRATCPCCGYPTINGRAAYDICSLCFWEDDGQDDKERYPGALGDPDEVLGGPNHDYSLTEARRNFADYLTMYRPTDIAFEFERVKTDLRRRIVAAYDRAVDGETTFAEADAEAYSLMDGLL